jgi:kumamolisin
VTVLVPVPGPADEPTAIRQDLAAFDRMFGLPAARLTIVTSLAGSAAPDQANFEEVGDLEIVHAVAPAATLRVVLFPLAQQLNAWDLLAGLRLAVSHTGVVVIGWVVGEHSFTPAQVSAMHAILRGAAAHHVTVVASSGKYGAFRTPDSPVKGVSLPASDPLVLAVGGTTLTADPATGAYMSETAWPASGGGFSHLYARPAYQEGVPGIATTRGVPDVAGDADPVGAMARVETAGGQGYLEAGLATSPAAALWGGLVALADQDAQHDLGCVNPVLYRIARSSSYHQAFHDLTTGTNGYPTAPGWDPVTGWGSPNAQVLVPLMTRRTAPSTT